MKKVVLKTIEQETALKDIANQIPIFAKKNGKLSGMVINTDDGWILKLGGLRGATFYYDTRKECLESCKQYGYEFYIED